MKLASNSSTVARHVAGPIQNDEFLVLEVHADASVSITYAYR